MPKRPFGGLSASEGSPTPAISSAVCSGAMFAASSASVIAML